MCLKNIRSQLQKELLKNCSFLVKWEILLKEIKYYKLQSLEYISPKYHPKATTKYNE